jgi:peptide/nickel transport system permease protein
MTEDHIEVQTPFRELVSGLTPTAVVCLSLLGLFIVCALTAPWIVPYGEGQILSDESFAPPDPTFLLGGDFLGRDLVTRLIFGMRITLSVAFAIALFAFFVGCSFGFLAAIIGGVFDTVISRIVDALIAFPSIMLALILIAALGPSIPVLIVTIAFIDSTRVYRVARALAMDVVVQDYIEAARLRGEGFNWIMWREILPNALPPLAAEFGIRFTYAILFISTLSFLGLGVQPPQSDLGVMIKENMQGLLYGSFAPLYPALGIASITITINLLVDWYLQQIGASLPEEM